MTRVGKWCSAWIEGYQKKTGERVSMIAMGDRRFASLFTTLRQRFRDSSSYVADKHIKGRAMFDKKSMMA